MGCIKGNMVLYQEVAMCADISSNLCEKKMHVFQAQKNILKKIASAFLPVLPLLVFWIFWLFHPAYWFHTDPAAWYFLDSLAPFAGKPYVYVDHPGTPVHLIGTFLLGLTYPFFDSKEAFIRYYIGKPEVFFVQANLFLLTANILTVLIFYKTISASLNRDKMLAASALSLMYFGIHPHGFNSLIYWSHNSFNFIFGTLWLLWLYYELQKKTALGWKTLSALGFAAGAISMTQLYLLAWLVGGGVSIFVFRLQSGGSIRQALRDGFIALAGGAVGILSLLAPISGQVPRMLEWLARLLGTDGLYGAGAQNLYSLNLIPLSIGFWAQYTPALMLSLGLTIIGLAAIAWLTRQKQLAMSPADFAMLAGMLAQIAALLLILSKFFSRIRYTLSLAAVLPVLVFIIIKLLENSPWNVVPIKRVLYLGIIISALFFMARDMQIQEQRDFVEKDAAQARSVAAASLAQSKAIAKDEVVTVYGFGTPLKCAGLLLANNWIRAFDREIGDLCPNQYALYDFAFDVEFNLTQPVPEIEDIDWDLVVWPGNNTSLPIYLESVGARNIPGSWGIERSKWFYIRPEQ